MGKTRKKTAPQFEVLISGEFWGAHDLWTEYLCMPRNPDGSISLRSSAREILAESGGCEEDDSLPATIGGKEVWGTDGDYVVGERLLPHDGGAEVTVPQNQFDVAARWLTERKWHWQQPEFGEARAQIRSALYGPEFFSPSKPLPLLGSMASDQPQEEGPNRLAAGYSGGDRAAPIHPRTRKPGEIVIRCAGPSKPWIIWRELVFIEWSRSFSVYARTGEAVDGGAESPGLLPRTARCLSWREVLKYVQSNDLATVSGSDPQPIDNYRVEPWQRDVIAAAMWRSTIVPFLSGLSEEN